MGNNQMLSPDAIDKMLSDNYTGEDLIEEYGDKDFIESYVGKRCLSESKFKQSTKRFGYSIANTTNRRIDIALTPAQFPTLRNTIVEDDSGAKILMPGGAKVETTAAIGSIVTAWNNPEEIKDAGLRIDAVADDGIVYADASGTVVVTADKAEASYRAFLNFIKKHPTVFAGIHVTCSNADMFSSALKTRRVTPFAIYGENIIPFQDAYKSTNMNPNKIEVLRNFQLDEETVSVISIPAATTVSFTFIAGAIVSLAHGLKNKVERENR